MAINYAPTAGVGGRRLITDSNFNQPQQQQGPLTKAYNTYGSAVEQQAGDYGNIMKNYQDLYGKLNQSPVGVGAPGTYNPSQYNYAPSANVNSALSNLGNLSQTGGYSAEDIANLRERGISPIRSVYASANRDIDRQRVLQGGYSPNYTASKVKMARDQSQQIADQMTKVNADLAQNVAQNKLSIAPQFSQQAQNESALSNEYGAKNTEAQNQAQQFNIGNKLSTDQFNSSLSNQRNGQLLQNLQGQNSLYGTTPALVNTFGNQAMQAANLQNTISQDNTRNGLQQINSMISGMR